MFALASQLLSIVLAAIVISKSYVDFRARRESVQMFVLWTVLWTGIVLVAVRPSIVDVLIGGRAGVGTFLGVAVVLLFFLGYRIYVRLERLEQKLTVVIQEMALRDNWSSKH